MSERESEGGARSDVSGVEELIRLPESDDELLRECEAETFRSGGPGGQHVNKVETGVRLRHTPTGIVVTCREERSQYRNKMNCLRKLREEAARLNHRPAKRVPTRRTRAARQRTLEEKSRRSRVKQLRSKPRADD
jgi:ribosome-associated protein